MNIKSPQQAAGCASSIGSVRGLHRFEAMGDALAAPRRRTGAFYCSEHGGYAVLSRNKRYSGQAGWSPRPAAGTSPRSSARSEPANFFFVDPRRVSTSSARLVTQIIQLLPVASRALVPLGRSYRWSRSRPEPQGCKHVPKSSGDTRVVQEGSHVPTRQALSPRPFSSRLRGGAPRPLRLHLASGRGRHGHGNSSATSAVFDRAQPARGHIGLHALFPALLGRRSFTPDRAPWLAAARAVAARRATFSAAPERRVTLLVGRRRAGAALCLRIASPSARSSARLLAREPLNAAARSRVQTAPADLAEVWRGTSSPRGRVAALVVGTQE